MSQPAIRNMSRKLTFTALSIVIGVGTMVSAPAFAEETKLAAMDTDLQGHLVKVVKEGAAKSGDEDKDKEQSFGTLSGEGLGKGVGLSTTEEQQSAIKEADKESEKKPDESTQTASIEMPAAKKVPLQKGKAESDGTVTHGETGVDWSKWVSTLADRWYWNLKNLEYKSAKTFRTARPALIHFTCYRNGTISNIYLRQTCGIPSYDQMQIEALKRCIPLPPFPEGSVRQSYSLLQGWECHPREAGESDFKPGSYGKNFPVEKVGLKPKSTSAGKLAAKPASKPAAKPASKPAAKPAAKPTASKPKH